MKASKVSKGQFGKGQSGNPNGRPKGKSNKATADAKAACGLIVDDPEYRKKLRERALAGDLPPAVETMLWHYAKGKPKETLALESDIPPFILRIEDGDSDESEG